MAFRFRRRITILPGLRLNVSKRGVSVSAGIRGASVTANQHGVWGNVGAPGTGLSYRSRLTDNQGQRLPPAARGQQPPAQQQTIQLSLDERGQLLTHTPTGEPLPNRERRRLWQQQEAAITEFLQAELDKINGDMELIINLHEETPPPHTPPPAYAVEPYPVAPPVAPEKPQLPTAPVAPQRRWYHTLLPGWYRRQQRRWQTARDDWQATTRQRQQQHEQAVAQWRQNYAQWQEQQQAHDAAEQAQHEAFNRRLYTEPDFMENLLLQELQNLSWPRETQVDCEIVQQGARLHLDVDLPEPDSLPQRSAQFGKTGRRLLIKTKSQRQQRETYARHIHGLVMRVLGVCLTTLPRLEEVWVAAYTQRLNTATGHVDDDYLLAVKVTREQWQQLNFNNLAAIDPIAALDHFELRRNMTKTGIFRPITPW